VIANGSIWKSGCEQDDLLTTRVRGTATPCWVAPVAGLRCQRRRRRRRRGGERDLRTVLTVTHFSQLQALLINDCKCTDAPDPALSALMPLILHRHSPSAAAAALRHIVATPPPEVPHRLGHPSPPGRDGAPRARSR